MKDLVKMCLTAIVSLLAMIVCCLITSCRSVQYVPVETVKRDSVYINKVHRDSIYQRDSIYVDRKGDTILIYKDRYLYKYKNLTDTMYVIRVDSIQVPYPVEKKLTRWQSMKMELGGWAFGAVIVFALIIVGWLVYRLRKDGIFIL